MASTEAAVASLGPRYAPDDPTLPEPWKGLIDGSTGLLYYWNPETNVTQYEKPASVAPLPSATPAAATPKMAPIPAAGSVQQTNLVAQQGQQPSQAPNQQVEQVSHFPQHQVQTMAHSFTHVGQIPHQDSHAHTEQQQGSQSGQVVQHTGQYMQHSGPQMVHHHGHHMPQHTNQLGPQQAAQQVPQQRPAQQMPPHLGGSHVAQPQGHQYQSPLQYPAYQQNAQQQNQNSSQVQSFPSEQEYKIGFQKRDEVRPPQGSQVPFSPQFHQKGASAIQNPPSGSNVVQMPQAGYHFGPSQQFGGSSANVQQPNSMVQPQQSVTDLVHQQYGPRFQNQMGSSMMHGRAANAPHAGLKTGFEDNLNVSTKNEFYFNTGREGPMGAQQPKLAALPMARNQQEPRVGDVRPIQNPGTSSVLHAPATRDVGNVYGHATVGPTFSDSPLIRPPFPGKSDANGLSSVEVYCQQHEVTTTGGNVPAPFMTFEATGFPPEILHEIHAAGFSAPTPIQAQTWPIAIQNRDIVAIAKTGSGKTLGYLIPAFMLLRQRRNNPQYGPTVLVLAPTRELATQIQDEAIKFGRSSRVSCTCLYGGAPKGPQLKELDRGTDIVVATPGRLNDILEMKKIDFRQVSLFVLDEADRMLDMGFEPQIRKIVNEIPPRRQTLMYTATWPKEVKKIASDLLRDPVQVNIGNVDELAANKSITQYVEVVPQFEKQRRLEQILRSQERGSKVIIFCSTKRLCDQLARSIGRHFGAAVIHGDKSQGERDWVLNQFRSGKCPVLVATDVAARGLDIKDIRVVINYDFPTGVEDYVHRIGRTGRAGASGVSYTFFSEQDWKHASELIKVLEGANQQVPPQVREIAMRGGPGFGKDRAGVNRFDSRSGGAGRWDSGGGRGGIDGGLGGRGGMDSGFGGRGGMDGGFGGHGGMDGGFGGRGGMGFGGRGGMRDGGFGGRGGVRDSGFGGRGGRNDLYSGRSNRGRGFGGGQSGWERNDRGPYDRYGNMDGRGRDRGRGRGRFDNRRGDVDRSRGRSRSRSPEKVRTWGYSSSSSRSRSRSRSRSWSRSPRRSRSRSWSRGRRSYSRSRSRERRYSRSRSRSYERNDKLPDHSSGPNDTVKPGAPELKISTVCPAPQSYVGCQDAVQLQVVDEGNELQNPKDVTALHVGDQTAT